MSNAPHEWTLEGFVEHFDFFHHKMLDHKFVWVLGAGASLASGIPLGRVQFRFALLKSLDYAVFC